jgi:hypothetical protein
MSAVSEKPLVLSTRLHTMIRSISGFLDAGVELVTNSNDAYQKAVRGNLREEQTSRPILIRVDYQKHLFVVTDNAIGMSAADMQQKLAVVGAFTSEEGVRGYFSRGAKDLISIGNVHFTGIKDGKLSEMELTIQSTVLTYRQDVPVTPEDRARLCIPKDGLRVEVRLLKNIKIPPLERLVTVSSFFNLRDIFANPNNHITMEVTDQTGKNVFSDRLLYTYPKVKPKKLIDTQFVLADWGEEAVVDFQLFEMEESMPTEQISAQREYGVLVCTDTTIHSNECFYSDILGNPYFKRVRGRVTCDFIDKLMHKFEHEEVDERNMFPCVKADRSGLNRRHLFVKDLYRTCYYMLRHVLQNEFKRRLKTNDLMVDITELLDEIDFPISNDKFVHDMTQLCPFSLKTREVDRKERKFLKKKAKNVKAQNPEAVYNFRDFSAEDFEKKEGHWKQIGTKMQILINAEDSFQTASRYYFLERVLVIEVNAKDTLLSQCVSLDETKTETFGTPMYRIDDEVLFLHTTCRLVSSSLASYVNQARVNQYAEDEVKNFTQQDLEIMRAELEFAILPGIYALLSSSEIVRSVVVNDVDPLE